MTDGAMISDAAAAEVRTALLEVLGYDAATRNALLSGLPAGFRGILPGGGAAPAVGLTLDIAALNARTRLTDGSVPLRRFLENALGLMGMVQQADALKRAMVEIESAASGAPPVDPAVPERLEAIIARDDMVPFGFMTGALAAARSVAKLTVPRHENGAPTMAGTSPVCHLGTGWLLTEDLLMTNHHVVNARGQGEPPAGDADLKAQAASMTVLFDYDSETSAGIAVAGGEIIATDPGLDYAVIRIDPTGRQGLPIAPAPIADVRPDSAIAVNVIQHPDGRPKRFAIRNNLATAATPRELRYFTDTLGGSSGSPVLDDTWQVVALHRGSAFVRGVRFQGREVAYVNVGTQLTAIVDHLRSTRRGEIPSLGI